MKKRLAPLFIFGISLFSTVSAFAQDAAADAGASSGHQLLKEYFIQGDWRFMSLVLVCLILGLAFCIERIITLNIATTNTDKLLDKINTALEAKDLEGAKEICKSTQGLSLIHI